MSQNLKPADAVTISEVRKVLDAPPTDSEGGSPEYILVLGADRRPGQTRARSDTILLARLDRDSRTVSTLSIPRDSRVPIDGHGLDKITHANAFGGPALAVSTVKSYTGLPIHHFVEIDFAGFADVVDALGGVTLDVDVAINDAQGSDTGGVSNVTSIPAGRQTLSGSQALTFVRSRAFADGDFTRIRHQQQFLKALATQALSKGNLPKLPGVINSVSKNTETDLSIAQIVSLATAFRGFSGDEIRSYTVPGVPQRVDGVSYVVSDPVAAKALFTAFKAGKDPVTP